MEDTRVSKSVMPVGWISLFLSVPLYFIIEPHVGDAILYFPFALSVLLLGMPHGAVDHLVPRFIDKYDTKLSVALVVLLYASVGTIYWVLWLYNPAISLGLFILLTIIHWGQGDNYIYSIIFNAGYIQDSKVGSITGILLKGSLPMIVPYISHTDRYVQTVESIVGIFGINSINGIGTQQSVYIAILYIAILSIIYVVNAIRIECLNSAKVDIMEVTGLLFYFWLLPPVYSIGVYFCFWHSIRHIGRLLDSDDMISAGRTIDLIRRFIVIATPMTLGGLGIIVFIYVFTDATYTTPDGLLAAYLVGIAVMTLPHFMVVTWMDMKQSIYKDIF